MKFIENHHAGGPQRGIGEYTAGEDAFRQIAQAGAWAARLFEADLVTNRFPERLVPLRGGAAGGEAGGKTARFEYPDLALYEWEQRGRDAGCLACSGRSLHH